MPRLPGGIREYARGKAGCVSGLFFDDGARAMRCLVIVGVPAGKGSGAA